MIKRYSEFIFENLNKSKAILNSKLEDYEKLKNFLISHNSIGYMGKFTEFLFNGVPYNELMSLYNDIIDFKSKNIKVNIDSYDKYELLLDDFDKKKIAYKFKSIYNKFPKEQKNLLHDENDGKVSFDNLDDETILTISKLYDIDDITPFIKKISRYKSLSDLSESIKRFLEGKSQSFDRESVKKMLDDNLQLFFENDNILIVKTKNWEAIKKVGPDTSWCIVRSKSTFESYTKNRSQFVVFDYTKDPFEVDFKIGFTVDINNRVIYAHDVLDNEVISDVKELLKINDVEISDINTVPKLDISKFNKTSKLKEIEEAILSSKIEEEEITKLLSILSWKLSRSKIGSEIENLIKKVFEKLLSQKGTEILLEEDVNKFKDCFTSKEQFDRIKSRLSANFILLSKTPPTHIFNSRYLDKVLKYYKNWNYKLENYGVEYYMNEVKTRREYADVILYYASKLTKKTNEILILIEYCKMIKGDEVDKQKIKKLIDNIKMRYTKYFYYNAFEIKYHFSEENYGAMEAKNIIVEDVIIKKPQYDICSKLRELINCNVIINYDKSAFISKVNSTHKIMNDKITKKVNSSHARHPTDEIIGQIINLIKDKLTFKSRKIVFKADIKFPITFKAVLSSNYKYNKLQPKEVTIVMK